MTSSENIHTAKDENVLYRRLLLFTAIVYPFFGYVNAYFLNIESKNLFYSRIAFSALVVVVLLAEQKWTLLHNKMYPIITSFMYLGLGHLMVIGYYNSFNFNHSIGVIMTIIGTSMVIKSKEYLRFYLWYISIIALIAIAFCPPSEVSKAITIGVFGCIILVSYILITFKITAENNLKEANQKLKKITEIFTQQNERLSLLADFIEHAPDAFQATDEEGNFIFMNTEGRQRLGFTLAQVEQLNVLQLESLFENKAQWYAHVQETKDKGGILIESSNYSQATGKDFPVEVRIRNIQINGKGYQIAISKDITEQKLQQTKIKENEEQLQSIFDSMTEGIMLQDEHSRIQRCNKSAEEIFGLTYEQMIGKASIDSTWKSVHEDGSDFPPATHPASIALKTRQAQLNVTLGVYKPNGTLKWIAINAIPLFNDNSAQPTSVITTFRDISAARAQEEKLKENEAQLQSIFDSMSEGIVLQDGQGKILRCNESAEKILGLSHDQMIGKKSIDPDWQSIHEDGTAFPGDTHPAMVALKSGKAQKNVIMGVTKKDNEVSWISINANPLFENNSKVATSVIATFEDITDVLNKNKEIHLLTNLVEQSPDAINVYDEQGNFLYANKAALEQFKYPREELLTMNINDITDAYDHDSKIFAEKIEELKKQKHIISQRVIEDKNKQLKTIEISASHTVIPNQGLITTFSRDISDKIIQEQKIATAIKDKEVAEHTTKIKEEFLANMSHEIRTPMNGVVGMIDLLEKTTSPTPQQLEYLHTIKSSSKTLLNIINDVLDLSKLEAGKMELRKENTNIIGLVNDIVQLYQNKADEKNIALLGSFGKNIPQNINTDGSRIKQVLSNFVSNAIKFTEQGKVNIHLEVLQQNGSEVTLKFAVSDSGIGIAKNDIKHLFGAFNQLDSSSSKIYEGTGLGLAISKKIVTLFKGEVGIDSEEGKGSTFWFTLKCNIAESIAQIENTVIQNAQNDEKVNLNVLLVDDKKVNLIVAKTMLLSFGCRVTTANDGLDAIEKFKIDKFDLVLMDIQMPKLDGAQATQQIKAEHSNTPPIIALTANAMEGDKEKYLAQGFDDYLAKPIEMDGLRDMLLKWKK